LITNGFIWKKDGNAMRRGDINYDNSQSKRIARKDVAQMIKFRTLKGDKT